MVVNRITLCTGAGVRVHCIFTMSTQWN